jgi:hypothetical protein
MVRSSNSTAGLRSHGQPPRAPSRVAIYETLEALLRVRELEPDERAPECEAQRDAGEEATGVR